MEDNKIHPNPLKKQIRFLVLILAAMSIVRKKKHIIKNKFFIHIKK